MEAAVSAFANLRNGNVFGLAALLVAALAVAWTVCCGRAGAPVEGESTSTEQPAPAPAEPQTEAAPSSEAWPHPRTEERQDERDEMVAVIRRYGLTDEKVLAAMKAVPRHEFVPSNLSTSAYDDGPLPIGYGQTISQPYIVAEMTRQLRLTSDGKVLEIGTGSGYQAAVLTEFTPHVFTIEIIAALAESAEERLKRLGYSTVEVRRADGYYGWEEEAPFDAIIVTAAAGQIPPPLLSQLANGGRMVIPVGGPFSVQTLMLVEKAADGSVRSRELMGVRFVPFVREE